MSFHDLPEDMTRLVRARLPLGTRISLWLTCKTEQAAEDNLPAKRLPLLAWAWAFMSNRLRHLDNTQVAARWRTDAAAFFRWLLYSRRWTVVDPDSTKRCRISGLGLHKVPDVAFRHCIFQCSWTPTLWFGFGWVDQCEYFRGAAIVFFDNPVPGNRPLLVAMYSPGIDTRWPMDRDSRRRLGFVRNPYRGPPPARNVSGLESIAQQTRDNRVVTLGRLG